MPAPESPPRRLIVAGVAGAGKTTLARAAAASLRLPYTEIDGLYHGPGWIPRESFVDDVDAFTRQPGWVIEWEYRSVRPMLAERADTLVWLDYPFRVAFARVICRTMRRTRTRERLWNGNVERGMWHAITSREGIIRWAFETRGRVRELGPTTAEAHPHLRIVRLRSQREADAWVADLG